MTRHGMTHKGMGSCLKLWFFSLSKYIKMTRVKVDKTEFWGVRS